MNLKTIIVDDEPKAIEIIERYVGRIPYLSMQKTFRDPLEALSFLKSHKIDLVLLDINMPNLSGIELSKLINPATHIIFTTAYPQYAIEGFDLNATDYLLKPIEYSRFLKATNKALGLYQQKKDAFIDDEILFFKSGSKIYKTDIPEILFFEKDGNYFTIHLKNNKTILIRLNFSDLLELLPNKIFVRVHKSFIVSIKQIDLIENDEIIIEQHHIPIGSSFKGNLSLFLPR